MIMVILVSMAVPLASNAIKREKERELRYDLWQMRDAIDHYKDAADRNAYRLRREGRGNASSTRSIPKGSR